MKERAPLAPAGKLMLAGLLAAAAGVTIQIISGHHYPKVPPVFFMLLIPSALLIFTRWRWPAILVTLVGLFLSWGLFTSGAYVRLYTPGNIGDSIGLWVQTVADALATIAGIMAIVQNYLMDTQKGLA